MAADDVGNVLTELQLNTLKTAFGIFDGDKDGLSPSEVTLAAAFNESKNSDGLVSLSSFISLFQIADPRLIHAPIREDRLQECFRLLSPDTPGKIPLKELRFVLQQLGEPLTDDEADRFVDWAMKVPDALCDGGMLDTDVLSKELLNRDPNIN